MNIETLRIFCDVVQHQSFSRGAKINEVSQSAATQSVHRVEEHFGVQLVDRSKRPFVLDARGPGVLRGLPRSAGTVRFGRSAGPFAAEWRSAGWCGVAAIYSVGLHDMSRCMQDFMRRYPKAKVRLEYLRAEQGVRRRAQRRSGPGHHLLSGGVARTERDSFAIGADGGGLPAGASA